MNGYWLRFHNHGERCCRSDQGLTCIAKQVALRGVDFSLPADPDRTLRVLDHARKPGQKPRIYLGATGWSNKEWVGTWYPKGTKPNDYPRG